MHSCKDVNSAWNFIKYWIWRLWLWCLFNHLEINLFLACEPYWKSRRPSCANLCPKVNTVWLFTHNSHLMNVYLSPHLLGVLVAAKLSVNLELSSPEGSCFTRVTTHFQGQGHPMANQGCKGSILTDRVTLKDHCSSWASCGIIWDLRCSSNEVYHFLCPVLFFHLP